MPRSSSDDDVMSLEDLLNDKSSLYAPGTVSNQVILPLVRLWMLRVIIKLQGSRSFIRSTSFSNDEVASALGFIEEVNADNAHFLGSIRRDR